jgi:hypothetical protein
MMAQAAGPLKWWDRALPDGSEHTPLAFQKCIWVHQGIYRNFVYLVLIPVSNVSLSTPWYNLFDFFFRKRFWAAAVLTFGTLPGGKSLLPIRSVPAPCLLSLCIALAGSRRRPAGRLCAAHRGLDPVPRLVLVLSW